MILLRMTKFLICIVIGFIILLFLSWYQSANAQQLQPAKSIGGPIGHALDRVQGIETKNTLFDAIEKITIEDLQSAIALADLPTGPGGVADESAKNCYSALLTYIQLKQKFKEDQGTQNKEYVIAKFQATRNLIRMLDTDSPVRRACAAFAADVKQDVRQLITGLATGLALKALAVP